MHCPLEILKLNISCCVASGWFARFNEGSSWFNQSSDLYKTASGKFLGSLKIHLNRGSLFNIVCYI